MSQDFDDGGAGQMEQSYVEQDAGIGFTLQHLATPCPIYIPNMHLSSTNDVHIVVSSFFQECLQWLM